MSSTDYRRIVEDAIQRMDALTWEKERIDIEIAKLKQFVFATVNLLPEDQARKVAARINGIIIEQSISNASLTEAIKKVLVSVYPTWQTVAMVRGHLIMNGFDFSSYSSNALASVSTTLRRLKEAGHANIDEIQGVTVYRATGSLRRMYKAETIKELKRREERQREGVSDVPNPFATTMAEMLKKPEQKNR